MQAVEALAADGSWGPLALRRAETTGAPEPGQPSVWIGDALDFRPEGSDANTEIVLRVTRRDWRIDPYALVLSMAKDNHSRRGAEAGGSEAELPPGPAVWSHLAPAPMPAAAFTRCADRELVLYELHLGSFTPEGTLRAAAARLGHVQSLGCTAISVMPVQQDARRLESGEANMWGYDVISLLAVDSVYGSPSDLAAFVAAAHRIGLAVIVDYVANHFMWGADGLYGPHYFLRHQETCWGPRPDFARPEVRALGLAAVEFYLALGFDGVRVDSTKSLRKLPNDAPDAAGAAFLGDLAALCRRRGRLTVAEDLEDGDGILQQGGLGFHLQWDMALFCWVFDALVNPADEYRDFGRVEDGLRGLAPSRGHTLRGRVIFMESHDTAPSDRYGRLPAAVHNGKAFLVADGEAEGGGDAFQKAKGALPYPSLAAVEASAFAIRRAALGLVIIMTAPGVPMLLQGQEACECRPYCWPRGPAVDWQRLQAVEGPSVQWRQLCRDLIALRLGGSATPSTGSARRPGQRPGPLMGDGLHAFHAHGGVLAYLRWAEVADSREEDLDGPDLALIVINCTNNNFPSYELGVPPSRSWRLALTTARGAGTGSDVLLQACVKANHSFPCSVSVSLQAYSALILMRES